MPRENDDACSAVISSAHGLSPQVRFTARPFDSRYARNPIIVTSCPAPFAALEWRPATGFPAVLDVGYAFQPTSSRATQSMRIVDIRETAIPLKSSLANSSFDFSEMTTSVVAVITDVMREGRPVAGFAFNSTGRYACGAQMRERFIPRIRAAKPDALLDGDGNLDPGKNPRLHDAAREGRRPQRALDRHRHHRGGGVGRGRQDRRQAAASPARRALQRRQASPTRCSAMSAAAGTGRARPSATCRTRCAAISMPATPW